MSTARRCRIRMSSSYPALVVIDWLFPQVATLRTRPQRAASGLDAVLLENPPEAEEFAGGGGEEVEADPSGAGDGPEVDLLLVLDELADRGLGAAGGGLAFCAGGAAQRLVAPLGRAGSCFTAGRAAAGGGAHPVPGLVVMVTGTGSLW